MIIERMSGPRSVIFAVAVAMGMVAAGSVSHAGKVNIIYPPKLASDFDKADDSATAGKNKHATAVNVAVQVNVVHRGNYRRRAIRRALGHRYLGFTKMYSGPRYPF